MGFIKYITKRKFKKQKKDKGSLFNSNLFEKLDSRYTKYEERKKLSSKIEKNKIEKDEYKSTMELAIEKFLGEYIFRAESEGLLKTISDNNLDDDVFKFIQDNNNLSDYDKFIKLRKFVDKKLNKNEDGTNDEIKVENSTIIDTKNEMKFWNISVKFLQNIDITTEKMNEKLEKISDLCSQIEEFNNEEIKTELINWTNECYKMESNLKCDALIEELNCLNAKLIEKVFTEANEKLEKTKTKIENASTIEELEMLTKEIEGIFELYNNKYKKTKINLTSKCSKLANLIVKKMEEIKQQEIKKNEIKKQLKNIKQDVKNANTTEELDKLLEKIDSVKSLSDNQEFYNQEFYSELYGIIESKKNKIQKNKEIFATVLRNEMLKSRKEEVKENKIETETEDKKEANEEAEKLKKQVMEKILNAISLRDKRDLYKLDSDILFYTSILSKEEISTLKTNISDAKKTIDEIINQNHDLLLGTLDEKLEKAKEKNDLEDIIKIEHEYSSFIGTINEQEEIKRKISIAKDIILTCKKNDNEHISYITEICLKKSVNEKIEKYNSIKQQLEELKKLNLAGLGINEEDYNNAIGSLEKLEKNNTIAVNERISEEFNDVIMDDKTRNIHLMQEILEEINRTEHIVPLLHIETVYENNKEQFSIRQQLAIEKALIEAKYNIEKSIKEGYSLAM